MKKNGFTLMELLGVIMILAVLAVIAFPPIITQIKKSKQEIKNSTKILITDSAKDYYEDNINNFEQTEGMTYCIDLSTLINQGYLNGKLKDEELNNIDITKKVKMIYHNSKFNYDVVKTCTNGITLTRNNIEVPIVTEGKGLYASTTEEGRYIYRGGDETNSKVNNFIELNEGTTQSPNFVKYRIISFENDGTIKVVRYESIGQYAWDTEGNRTAENENDFCMLGESSGCNAWGNMLNTYENNVALGTSFHYKKYDNDESTNLDITPTEDYEVTDNAYLNDFLNSRISNSEDSWQAAINLDRYVDTHSFDVGGVYYITTYTGNSKGINKEKQEEKTLTWNGKIGLINITEYVESSTNSSCSSIYSNDYYAITSNGTNLRYEIENDNWPCKINNWMYVDYRQWTISPATFSVAMRDVWNVSEKGYFDMNTAKNAFAVRPAFYLKASTSLKGEGTEANPFRLVGE